MIIGHTPLHLAPRNGHSQVFNALIAHGAYHIKDWKILIVKREVDKMINYLRPIQDKATVVNTPDTEGISCFH